jgi:hypothetical protein
LASVSLQRRRRRARERDTPTFNEFVQYLIDPATAAEGPFNPHWRLQAEMCQPCSAVDYDFIGHFETLQADADFVLRSVLGPSASSVVKFPDTDRDNPVDDKRKRSTSLVKQFFSDVPKQQQWKLMEVYGADFDLFGYE